MKYVVLNVVRNVFWLMVCGRTKGIKRAVTDLGHRQINLLYSHMPATPKPEKISLRLQDVNDEIPQFRSSSYVGEIAENSQRGAPVTFLGSALAEVFDHDRGTNGSFAIRLDGAGDTFEVKTDFTTRACVVAVTLVVAVVVGGRHC